MGIGCFFFKREGDDGVIRSFPPRGSSDLRAPVGPVARPLRAGEPTAGTRSSSGLPEARAQQVDHGQAPRGQDRKSTRLNSSHANISYAVFCLKQNSCRHFTSLFFLCSYTI